MSRHDAIPPKITNHSEKQSDQMPQDDSIAAITYVEIHDGSLPVPARLIGSYPKLVKF